MVGVGEPVGGQGIVVESDNGWHWWQCALRHQKLDRT